MSLQIVTVKEVDKGEKQKIRLLIICRHWYSV